jgi:hypothetical protein
MAAIQAVDLFYEHYLYVSLQSSDPQRIHKSFRQFTILEGKDFIETLGSEFGIDL